MLALAACVIALISIVNAFRSDNTTGVSGGTGGNQSGKSSKKSKGKSAKQTDVPKTYVVQPGDNIGTIAQKFGIRVPVIEKLNPKIDPQTINVGQTLKLRN